MGPTLATVAFTHNPSPIYKITILSRCVPETFRTMNSFEVEKSSTV